MLRDTESFVRLRRETIDACADIDLDLRFVVIDDSAGTDPDVVVLEEFGDIRVLTPPFNLGHQRAIVYGLRHILDDVHDTDIVITMDSDGEDQPADVPRLLLALDTENVPLAVAQRTKRSEPLRFRLMYVVFRLMFRVLTGTTIRSGNFAAQRGNSLAVTIQHPSFDLCYSSTLLALRRPTATVPCARGRRFAGTSRMNTYSLIAHGVRMLLPFSERIAVRMMVMASVSAAFLVAFLVAMASGAFGDSIGPATLSALIVLLSVFAASFAAFIVLFSGFTQASAIAIHGIGAPDPHRTSPLS
jgi:glycosyltransferase involved in cell wall biosynthesis